VFPSFLNVKLPPPIVAAGILVLFWRISLLLALEFTLLLGLLSGLLGELVVVDSNILTNKSSNVMDLDLNVRVPALLNGVAVKMSI